MNLSILIKQKESQLANEILNHMYPHDKFTDATREQKAIDDIKWTLLFVGEAYKYQNIKIIEHLLIWFEDLFVGLGIDKLHVYILYNSLKLILHKEFQNQEVDQFLSQIDVHQLNKDNYLLTNNPYEVEMDEYLNALLHSNKEKAYKVIQDSLSKGAQIEDIYIYIFQEAMRHVGHLWHIGQISVAREHYCTVITQYMMTNLVHDELVKPKINLKLLACTVGSELHELGIRMVVDMFEMSGWETMYLGPNLPSNELLRYAEEYQPDIIAISITMVYHLSMLKDAISLIKNSPKLKKTKVIVGGFPFIENPELSRLVGADGFARDAKEGFEVARNLLS